MSQLLGEDRDQLRFTSLDMLVTDDSIARVIDLFVENLDLSALRFCQTGMSADGRPAYDPKGMLKLYIYGNVHQIRSSRKLEFACRTNVEAMWLMRGQTPNFRTINGFRKDNAHCLKDVFKSFNRNAFRVLERGFNSIDGSKFKAVNSKQRNFTQNNLDERLERLADKISKYMSMLDEADKEEERKEKKGLLTREEIEEKLESLRERQALYEGYLEHMQTHGLRQLSLTDPDAKLMKDKQTFAVGYNVQHSSRFEDAHDHEFRSHRSADRSRTVGTDDEGTARRRDRRKIGCNSGQRLSGSERHGELFGVGNCSTCDSCSRRQRDT